MPDLPAFKDLYLKTSRENIQVLKTSLKELFLQSGNTTAIDEIHRNAHTLKSKSLLMGYTDIAALAKSIEDTFYEIKNGKTTVSQELLANLSNTVIGLDKALETL